MTDRDFIARIPAGDWLTIEDGFVVYWPTRRGFMTASVLRAIADELDRRNADWAAEVQAELAKESE